MTKPGFIKSRVKSIFLTNDIKTQTLIYNDFINKRDNQIQKVCYCGHTIDCDCGNPSQEEFKTSVLNNRIKEKDL